MAVAGSERELVPLSTRSIFHCDYKSSDNASSCRSGNRYGNNCTVANGYSHANPNEYTLSYSDDNTNSITHEHTSTNKYSFPHSNGNANPVAHEYASANVHAKPNGYLELDHRGYIGWSNRQSHSP